MVFYYFESEIKKIKLERSYYQKLFLICFDERQFAFNLLQVKKPLLSICKFREVSDRWSGNC